jgi:hypothetical protein
MGQGSAIWRLGKVAAIWYVVAHVISILANTFGSYFVQLPYLAVSGFVLHAISVIFSISPGQDDSRLWNRVGGCAVVGLWMFLSLHTIQNDDVHGITRRIDRMSETASSWVGAGSAAVSRSPAVEHLSQASRLIFDQSSPEALNQARELLRSIPASASEFRSADSLLHVVERKEREKEEQKENPVDRCPIQIVRRDQGGGRLQIVLRNEGRIPVKTFRYRLAHYRMETGTRIEPDLIFRVDKILEPNETWTLQTSYELLKTGVYVDFSVTTWETLSNSKIE